MSVLTEDGSLSIRHDTFFERRRPALDTAFSLLQVGGGGAQLPFFPVPPYEHSRTRRSGTNIVRLAIAIRGTMLGLISHFGQFFT